MKIEMQLPLTTTVTPSCTREGEAYRLVEYLPTYKVALEIRGKNKSSVERLPLLAHYLCE